MTAESAPLDALIVAVPETAGSALYGMVDVLSATGNIWQTLARSGTPQTLIRPRIISTSCQPFQCNNRIPVQADLQIGDDPRPDILILPELWLSPEENLNGRYPELMAWIRKKYAEGVFLYSACSGSLMLAESGLLDGHDATSHWGYEQLFRNSYPEVNFHAEANLAFADTAGRIVTAGGTTSWHDLVIHIIARHISPGEAIRIAKVYLLKWHSEGQRPYTPLIRRTLHADSMVRACEEWLGEHFSEHNCISQLVEFAGIPERSLKRRFKSATGSSLIDFIQNLRVEEAKRLLETDNRAVEEISAVIGYEEPAFFRRLFKRITGVTPSQYRRMFQPVTHGLSGDRPARR